MEEILSNVLSNAVWHVPAGGHLRIGLRPEGAAAAWTIADDGPGIPAHILPRVTKPFVRGDPSRGSQVGSGLGLAIAAQWVKAHGGRLQVCTDHGTCVTIRLPLR